MFQIGGLFYNELSKSSPANMSGRAIESSSYYNHFSRPRSIEQPAVKDRSVVKFQVKGMETLKAQRKPLDFDRGWSESGGSKWQDTSEGQVSSTTFLV